VRRRRRKRRRKRRRRRRSSQLGAETSVWPLRWGWVLFPASG